MEVGKKEALAEAEQEKKDVIALNNLQKENKENNANGG